jgi:hypothetical protein
MVTDAEPGHLNGLNRLSADCCEGPLNCLGFCAVWPPSSEMGRGRYLGNEMTIPKRRTWEILTFEETNLNFDEVFNSSKASESYFAGCVTGRNQKSKKAASRSNTRRRPPRLKL